MRQLLKFLVYFVVAVVALFVITGLAIKFFFDPNDYKADIETAVRDATGREFTIEGDLAFTLFPWLALETDRMTLGNAEGFGEDPFFQIDSASLSVKIMPLIFSNRLSIGTASFDSLRVNLAVDAGGRTNWDDLVERQEVAAEVQIEEDTGPSVSVKKDLALDVANVAIRDAAFTYRDDQAGSAYRLDDVNLETGRITSDNPIPIAGGFRFEAQPDNIIGQIDVALTASINPDTGDVVLDGLVLDTRIEGLTEAPADIRMSAPAFAINMTNKTMAPGSIELSVFDLDLAATIEPFSYAGTPTPNATLSIAAFSPRSLVTALGAELPPTADPAALQLFQLDARADVSASRIALSDIALVIDDTTFRGQLAVPRGESGSFELDLAGDTIDLNRYMAPATEEDVPVEDEEAPPVEIPSDLLRAFNAQGRLTLDEALMGRILFEDVELVLSLSDGQLRLHPISSRLFDGQYQGDVRVDASGDVPVLSVNERIQDVSLAPLGMAMFERQNLSGTINGVFRLTGTGHDMGAVQKSLNGDVSFSVADGAWEGTDVWYQLRRARALIRRQPAPTPELPARTRFSEVSATGKVEDGVLNNNDFRAELPFMLLTGSGTVNLVEATVDYGLNARILDKPELMGEVTEAEIADLTRTELPVRISGSLAEPSFGLDLESLAKERVEGEVKDRLLDLLGEEAAEPGAEDLTEDGEPAEEEEDVEDVLKRGLRDLIKKRD